MNSFMNIKHFIENNHELDLKPHQLRRAIRREQRRCHIYNVMMVHRKSIAIIRMKSEQCYGVNDD